jgi:tetrahydromethanopterin S-methyltransferase subunit G
MVVAIDDRTDKRLDRIEEKIDKLTDALVTIARFEEKMDTYARYREDSWARMNKFSEKLDCIEKSVAENANTVQVINKLFWAVILAAIGSVIAHFGMM